jgi:hypothetical protein
LNSVVFAQESWQQSDFVNRTANAVDDSLHECTQQQIGWCIASISNQLDLLVSVLDC